MWAILLRPHCVDGKLSFVVTNIPFPLDMPEAGIYTKDN